MKSARHPEEPKRVGIWIRVSTEDQARGESPEHHETRARMYADSRGWTVVEVYNLAGVSGKSVMGHPETKRMLADIRAGRITGLIFSKPRAKYGQRTGMDDHARSDRAAPRHGLTSTTTGSARLCNYIEEVHEAAFGSITRCDHTLRNSAHRP